MEGWLEADQPSRERGFIAIPIHALTLLPGPLLWIPHPPPKSYQETQCTGPRQPPPLAGRGWVGRRSTGLAAGPRGAACALSLGKRAARPLHPNSPTAALPGRRKGRRRPGWPVVCLELGRAGLCVCACARTLAQKGCPVFTRGRVGRSNPESAVLRGNDWLASPATARPPTPLRPIPLPPLPRHRAPCPGLAVQEEGSQELRAVL